MKLSIIIPVFNTEKYIVRCLDSLYNQQLNEDDFEILVIDDGSEDGSLALAQKYLSLHKNIYIYSQENQGVGAARNTGISLAKGEYIYFIDPDDYLLVGVLNTLIDYSNEYKPDVLTFVSKINSESSESIVPKISTSVSKLFNIKKQTGIEYIAKNNYKNEVWWYFINKSFLDSINLKFIHGKWMEDAIFTASLFLKAKSVIAIPLDTHRHVRVEGSAMTSKEPMHYLKVINDNANAAIVFNSIINNLEVNTDTHRSCILRLKARQQSFVFFMLMRVLKSNINKQEILPLLNKMKSVNAYPLDSFLKVDYGGLKFLILSKLVSNKYIYYILFILTNPFLKRMN